MADLNCPTCGGLTMTMKRDGRDVAITCSKCRQKYKTDLKGNAHTITEAGKHNVKTGKIKRTVVVDMGAKKRKKKK